MKLRKGVHESTIYCYDRVFGEAFYPSRKQRTSGLNMFVVISEPT